MFRLEKSLLVNNVAKMYVAWFNKHQRNMYCFGIGYDRETKINPSNQFKFKKLRNCDELKRLLNEKGYTMNLLMNSNVEKKEFSNDIAFLKKLLLVPMFNSDLAVNFIKNIISKNDLEEESTLKKIIGFVKDIQLKKQKERLFKILNMRNNQLFNNINDKLNIDGKTKQQNYPSLSTLNVSFTSHTMSTLFY